MKKFAFILLAIILSSPLASLLSAVVSHYMAVPESLQEDYYQYAPFMAGVYVVSIFFIPFYIVLGIPVTYLIDFVTKKFFFSTSALKKYFIKLIGYTMAAFVLSGFEADWFKTLLIPIYTYFHMLLLLRVDRYSGGKKEYRGKTRSIS
jgi:hypothetical protein